MDIKNLITKNTPIITFSSSTQEDPRKLSKILKIDSSIIKCWNNWIEIDGTWYYYKNFENYQSPEENFINELIGEFIATYLELETIHYSIGYNQEKNEYGLLSKSFRNKKTKYLTPDQLLIPKNCINLNNIKEIKYNCKNEKNYQKLVNQILKMIALDIYMNQRDRTRNNQLYKKENGCLYLAPLYDYEQSFYVDKKENTPSTIYKAYIFGLDLTNIEEIKRYPELIEIFKLLLSLDIKTIIKDIEHIYKLSIPKEKIEQYDELNQKTKKLIYNAIK